ncbi:hypothetical protein FA95DRAFT_1609847 [Auriscalpium vulgare]|uniref:Uncharacterized protein n=1 Tax=Auriscalpium vulgare TaxID=40419 RepID=A0ACB8RG43_9AGAM|nr:hypothetical protein FA95DRAFT_1609847 [Auriscalpium vulgare]
MDAEGQGDHNLLGPSEEYLASVKVFPFIPRLKKDVIQNIDSALTWDQLTASDINFAIVRPLVFKYARIRNPSIVYVCLVVRSHFLAAAEGDLAFAGVSQARAHLCEILAMKLVNHFANNRIELVAVLTTSWSPLAGASHDVFAEVCSILGTKHNEDVDDPQSALEMAIATRAKRFISSPLVQQVVNDIYTGRVVYGTASTGPIVADTYKQRAIEIYDSRNASWLNHYRLRVPKYGAILEFLNFACLLITFILCLSYRDVNALHPFEVLFLVFAAAFALEEYTASMEHGWGIYIANMWNIFDTSFIVVTLVYVGCRIKGLAYNDPDASDLGFDILACGACILFPRLAFFLVSNNVVILALRAMTAEFVFFMGIAAICFSGLLFTLWTLAPSKSQWTIKAISWLLVQIWFGNTYLSFGQASSFHPFFGPILMTGFAALSNTLLLTILISILSNTFARIDENANQEYLFQFTIITLEGMQSDALFSYQPPFNLFAFAILWPASFFASPRTLHTANVFMIRLTSFPVLILISIYEKFLYTHPSLRESTQSAAQSLYNSLPRPMKSLPILEAIMGTNANDIYEAIFEVDADLVDDDDNNDLFAYDPEEDRVGLRSWASRENGGTHTPTPTSQVHPANFPTVRTPDRPGAGRGRRSSSFPRSPVGGKASGSPRHRNVSLRPPSVADRASAGEMPAAAPQSPLSRLFGARLDAGNGSAAQPARMDRIEEGMRRVQELLEDVRELPVTRLKDEMKELQERQARIEGLLLMLTRGMRNDHSGPSRHDTL